jgi:hypothetical protein
VKNLQGGGLRPGNPDLYHNPKQIQKPMGHSSIKVTFDTYGHPGFKVPLLSLGT